MKKTISVLLAFVLLMSLSVTAFAADDSTNLTEAGSADVTVTGTYEAGTTGNGTVYSVDIAWSGMSFTYHAEKEPVWQTTTHSYSEAVEAYWEGEGNITVTNHSNTGIDVTPVYTQADGFENVSMTFSESPMRVASAELNNAAETGEITVTPDGSLPAETAAGATIGSIKVTISAGTDITVDEANLLKTKVDTLVSELQAENLTTEATSLQTLGIGLGKQIELFEAGSVTQAQLNSSYNNALKYYREYSALV